MRFYLDTEFIESGPFKPIHLLSVGMVAEDHRQLYGIHTECPLADANDWVKTNVLPYLYTHPAIEGRLSLLASEISQFCDPDKYGKPEFWGYYADYDWVVFCQMFGSMVDLPKGWPMYCRDIKQWADELGNPRLPEQKTVEHNALNDARWNKSAFDFLNHRATASHETFPRG